MSQVNLFSYMRLSDCLIYMVIKTGVVLPSHLSNDEKIQLATSFLKDFEVENALICNRLIRSTETDQLLPHMLLACS